MLLYIGNERETVCTKMSAMASSSSTRKRKRESSLTGTQLREEIQDNYFDSFEHYLNGRLRGRARHATSVRNSIDFNATVTEKYKELRKKLFNKENKVKQNTVNIREKDFKRLKDKINVRCNEKGGLSRDGWGGTDFDFVIYDYFFLWYEKNVVIYTVNLDVRDDKGVKAGLETFRTTANPRSSRLEIESGWNGKKNIFLLLKGGHYEVLMVNEGVTEAQLNAFQNKYGNEVKYGWETYFTIALPLVSPNGMCYWNAVAKAFSMSTINLPRGTPIARRERKKLPPETVDLAGDAEPDAKLPPPPPPPETVDLSKSDDEGETVDMKGEIVTIKLDDAIEDPRDKNDKDFLEPSSSRELKWLASVYEEPNNPDDESSDLIDNYEILFRLYSRFPSQTDSNKLCSLLGKLQNSRRRIGYYLHNPNFPKEGDDSVSKNREQRDKLEKYNAELKKGGRPNHREPKPPVKVFTQFFDYKGVLIMDIWSQEPLTQEELEIFKSIVKPEADAKLPPPPPPEKTIDLTGENLYKLKF